MIVGSSYSNWPKSLLKLRLWYIRIESLCLQMRTRFGQAHNVPTIKKSTRGASLKALEEDHRIGL
jgi:hypothetical protein